MPKVHLMGLHSVLKVSQHKLTQSHMSMRQRRAERRQGAHCLGRVPCRALPARVRAAMEPMLCHSVGRVPAQTPCLSRKLSRRSSSARNS